MKIKIIISNKSMHSVIRIMWWLDFCDVRIRWMLKEKLQIKWTDGKINQKWTKNITRIKVFKRMNSYEMASVSQHDQRNGLQSRKRENWEIFANNCHKIGNILSHESAKIRGENTSSL